MLVVLDEELPPIVVHRPTGRVVDGMHRLAAARARGDRTISAYLLDVPERSLFTVAVSLNVSHGKPLTHNDRLAAAVRILKENPALSDRYVASVAALSPRTVSRVRRSTVEVAHLNTRIGLDGKQRRTDTDSVANGRQYAGELILQRPGASLREIAQAAGISLGTAHDVKRRLTLGRSPVPEGRGARSDPPEAGEAVQRPQRLQRLQRETADGPLGREPTELLDRLRKDPALRLSQTGRFLLRCFAVQDVDSSAWTRLATTIPPHSAGGVVRLARACADRWIRFADNVEREARARERSGASV
ncbi:ParB/RepB/Spo0J family partition protein [Streptomyces aurantiacus]|uniref:Uncharacterized protein n=1 Tax=Streptomyces aurantiacus TaxID=47760 RepID=A0A7G1NR69_9ACTN|nr:ParB/RepB/Spo0J family partition protein [Streptomyces aurantiacus]BCL25329.1 hypothetical protein GCM10017557_01880 [Streptomyces aurantiacus]